MLSRARTRSSHSQKHITYVFALLLVLRASAPLSRSLHHRARLALSLNADASPESFSTYFICKCFFRHTVQLGWSTENLSLEWCSALFSFVCFSRIVYVPYSLAVSIWSRAHSSGRRIERERRRMESCYNLRVECAQAYESYIWTVHTLAHNL